MDVKCCFLCRQYIYIYIYISVVGSPASALLVCPSWGLPLTSLSFRVISLMGDLDLRVRFHFLPYVQFVSL